MSGEDVIEAMDGAYADCDKARSTWLPRTLILTVPIRDRSSLKDWKRMATRYDRSPTVFLSAIARAPVVLFWLCILSLRHRDWTTGQNFTVWTVLFIAWLRSRKTER